MKADDPVQGERCITYHNDTRTPRPLKVQEKAQGGCSTYQTTKATGGPPCHRTGQAGRGHNEVTSTSIRTWQRGRLGDTRPSPPRNRLSRGVPHQDQPDRATSQHDRTHGMKEEGTRRTTVGQPTRTPPLRTREGLEGGDSQKS